MSPLIRGSLAACGALTLVGSLVAASDLIEGYPIPGGQAVRYTLAAAVLLAIARGRLPRPTPREVAWLVALAASGLVLFNLFVVEGVREGDPATVGVIIGCVPVVLALLGPLAVSTYACVLALPLLAVWALASGGPALPTPTTQELAAIAYLGAVVTAGGFLLWYSALGLLGVERAGLFSGVLPVSALACAAAIGSAQVTPARLGAVGVVALGVTLGMRVAPPAAPVAAPPP